LDFKQEDDFLTVNVGNIILATGYDLFDCRRVSQYGYGRLANVFTSLEFERLSNAAGPTGARSCCETGSPCRIAWAYPLRGQPGFGTTSVLLVHLLHAIPQVRAPGRGTDRRARLRNFIIDIRTPAKTYDEFYQRVLEENAVFVRGKVAEVTDAARLPAKREAHYPG